MIPSLGAIVLAAVLAAIGVACLVKASRLIRQTGNTSDPRQDRIFAIWFGVGAVLSGTGWGGLMGIFLVYGRLL